MMILPDMNRDRGWIAADEASVETIYYDAIIYGGDGNAVAYVCGSAELGIAGLDRANLIAAAPDLLEALEAGMDFYKRGDSSGWNWDTFAKKMEVAIAKANGESP